MPSSDAGFGTAGCRARCADLQVHLCVAPSLCKIRSGPEGYQKVWSCLVWSYLVMRYELNRTYSALRHTRFQGQPPSGPTPAPAMSADRNSATFSVADEDHTLGNALRFFLNKKCESSANVTVQLFAVVSHGCHAMQPQCGLLWLQHPPSNRKHDLCAGADHRYASASQQA